MIRGPWIQHLHASTFDQVYQPCITIFATLVEVHPRILPVKLPRVWHCLKKGLFEDFPNYAIECESWPLRLGNFDPITYLHNGHSCKVLSKCSQRFQRRCWTENVDRQCTSDDDKQKPFTLTHHEHFMFRCANVGYELS